MSLIQASTLPQFICDPNLIQLINALHRNILVILSFLRFLYLFLVYFSFSYFATPTSRSYGLLIFFSLIMQDYPLALLQSNELFDMITYTIQPMSVMSLSLIIPGMRHQQRLGTGDRWEQIVFQLSKHKLNGFQSVYCQNSEHPEQDMGGGGCVNVYTEHFYVNV